MTSMLGSSVVVTVELSVPVTGVSWGSVASTSTVLVMEPASMSAWVTV
jgi:hypothetical protein